jgi:hypothetical protein
MVRTVHWVFRYQGHQETYQSPNEGVFLASDAHAALSFDRAQSRVVEKRIRMDECRKFSPQTDDDAFLKVVPQPSSSGRFIYSRQ